MTLFATFRRRLHGIAAGSAALFIVLAVTIAIRNGVPFGVDTGALTWVAGHRPRAVVTGATAVTDSGAGIYAYGLAVIAGVIAGLVAGRGLRRKILTSVAAIAFLGAVQALRLVLVTLIGRPRPPSADWAVEASGYAFPSGHTTNSAVIAGLFLWAIRGCGRRSVRIAVTACACAWAIAVGLSRVYLGVHWVSDVVGGWLFAAALLTMVALLTVGRRSDPAVADAGPEPR